MKRLTTYCLTLTLLASCQRSPTPKIESVLVDYADDMKHLMAVREIDSVVWVLQSGKTYQYDFNQFDTVFRVWKRGDTILIRVKGENGHLQKYVYDSLGLPIFMEDRFAKRKIRWLTRDDQVLRIVNNAPNLPDTTFYNFKNGRIKSRFEKKEDYDFEYAQYQYNSSGRLSSIVDTMIYPVNHHYHKYEKELIWENSNLKQVNEVFTPGKRKSTFFDSQGFPKRIVEILESGDTIGFEIKKL